MSRFYVTPAFFSTKHENCRTFFNSSLHWHEGLLMRITIPASDPPIDLSEDRTKTNISHFIKPVSLSSFLRRDWSGHLFFLSVAPFASSKFVSVAPASNKRRECERHFFFCSNYFLQCHGVSWRKRCPPPSGGPLEGHFSNAALTDFCDQRHLALFAKSGSLYVLPQWYGVEKCNHNLILKIYNVSDDRGTVREHMYIHMSLCVREYVKCAMKQFNMTISSKELPHLKHSGKTQNCIRNSFAS